MQSKAQESMPIRWSPPPPRTGWLGEWDKFIGPGASRAELWLILFSAFAGAIFVPWNAIRLGLGWSLLQLIVMSLVALDLWGGVVTNATNTCKRWYHRPGQGFRQHMGFIVMHVHPFLVGWLFLGGAGTWYGLSLYLFLVVAAWAVLAVPLEIQRPAALGLTVAGILLGLYFLPVIPGMEWFVLVFFLKLLAAHLVTEAPFATG